MGDSIRDDSTIVERRDALAATADVRVESTAEDRLQRRCVYCAFPCETSICTNRAPLFISDHWMRFAGYDRICPQLIDIDDNRMLLVLPGDNMYKTENAEWVPMRKLPYAATHDNKNSALHRIEFAKKPQWSNWKIIMQNCPDRPVDL